MKKFLKNVFISINSQDGRISIFQFGVYPILITIISILSLGLLNIIVTLTNIDMINNFYKMMEPIILILGMLYVLFTVTIKRLHDLDKKGWWSLLLFIPFLGFLLVIYLGFFKGTKGENKYGPDPLAKN